MIEHIRSEITEGLDHLVHAPVKDVIGKTKRIMPYTLLSLVKMTGEGIAETQSRITKVTEISFAASEAADVGQTAIEGVSDGITSPVGLALVESAQSMADYTREADDILAAMDPHVKAASAAVAALKTALKSIYELQEKALITERLAYEAQLIAIANGDDFLKQI